MKEKEIIIGIDVSKATLDVCILANNKPHHQQIKNTTKSIQSWINKLTKEYQADNIVVCMENTGYYNWPCYDVLGSKDIELYTINPLHLKRSMGMVRGKNDSIDSFRIAKFIALHRTELKVTQIARTQIREIQALVAHRSRLIETRTKLSVPAQELSFLMDNKLSKKVKNYSLKLIASLNMQIKAIEKDIEEIINSDEQLAELYKYITSVQGVGKVLAWNMLIKTNEFKSINDPRKLACYSGVVPFEHQSGSSIHKKPKVSYMADKTLKKLLHMAALRAIQLTGDLQNYYCRKVAEGKNKMLVINAVRNKIVARICSMVNNKKMYQPHWDLS